MESGREPRPRLRLTPWSVVRGVALVAVALLAVRLAFDALRPLGWLAVAVMLAALLHPVVTALSRRVPRWLAIVLVLVGLLGAVGGLAYGAFDDLETQLTRIERAAPRAARDVERSERFGEFAREIELGERVDGFVEELPLRLQGGESQVSVIRSAASRGVTFLITGVLTVFLLISGPRLVRSGLDQIRDPHDREDVAALLARAHRRWFAYLVLTAGRAGVAGLVTYLVAWRVDVPAPVLLALWVAAWSLVPTIGVAVGAVALALLTVPESFEMAGAVLALMAGYQVLEAVFVQPRLEARSLHVGSFLTFVAAALGLEAYGIGGMIGAVVAMVFVVSLLREIGVSEAQGLPGAALGLFDRRPYTPAP